ncbi:DUF4330 family protein [bacterium 3DAC]|nr:DUF4330 family protein [bacterium 3DAC]
MPRKKKHTIDIILSIVILVVIFSIIFYLWKIIKSPQKTADTGYTATITLVWRNVPKELATNIRIHDPILISDKPTYIVVDKQVKPYLKAIPTPQSATVAESKDTYNIYLKIRNIEPLSATVPPVGKNLALLGNLIRIQSYIWKFDGIVVDVQTGAFTRAPDYLEKPSTNNCNYKIIARSVYPSVIKNMKINEALYDVLGQKVLILKDIKTTHPFIYGWTPKGIKAFPDPTKTDVILTVSPISGEIPIKINGKEALSGSSLEIRGHNWRVWGRIIEVTCP